MDAGQSYQSNSRKTELKTSSFKEIQSEAVKEYEETLNQLRNDNFNLKVTLFLYEQAHKETYHIEGNSNDKKEDCLQTIVNLKIEIENLKKLKENKEELLQNSAKEYFEQVEKYQTKLLEAQKKIEEQKEFIGILEQLPTVRDYNEVSRQYSEMVHESEYRKKLLAEKELDIKLAHLETEKLQDEISALLSKDKQRDEAIKRCVLNLHEEIGNITKYLKPTMKSATKSPNGTELLSFLEDLKRSLSEVRDFLVKNFSAANLNENSLATKDSYASQVSVNCVVQPGECSLVDKDLIQSEIVDYFNEPISHSKKSMQYDLETQNIESGDSDLKTFNKLETNVEIISELKNENYTLMQKMKENIKIIENFTRAFSTIEEKEHELKDELGDAYTKINYLEEELEKKQNLLDLEIYMPFVSSADKASQYDFGIQSGSLMQEINSEIIQNLTASCSDLEKKEREFKEQLSKARSKIKRLELKLECQKLKNQNVK